MSRMKFESSRLTVWSRLSAFFACAAVFFSTAVALGGTVVSDLSAQHFAAGTSPITDASIRTAGAGQPAPFNGVVLGDDRQAGALGSFSFTHLFNLDGASATAGFITFGLIDIDSPKKGPATIQVSFDGIAQPLAPFRGISEGLSSFDVVTVPVSTGLLADGTLNVQIQAIHNAPGFIGNAIGIDFSKLTITTSALPPQAPGTGGGGSDGDGEGGGGGNNNGGGNGGGNGPPAVPLPPGALPAGLLMLAIVCFKFWPGRWRDSIVAAF